MSIFLLQFFVLTNNHLLLSILTHLKILHNTLNLPRKTPRLIPFPLKILAINNIQQPHVTIKHGFEDDSTFDAVDGDLAGEFFYDDVVDDLGLEEGVGFGILTLRRCVHDALHDVFIPLIEHHCIHPTRRLPQINLLRLIILLRLPNPHRLPLPLLMTQIRHNRLFSVLQSLIQILLSHQHGFWLFFDTEGGTGALFVRSYLEGAGAEFVEHGSIAYLQPLRLSINLRWISAELLHVR